MILKINWNNFEDWTEPSGWNKKITANNDNNWSIEFDPRMENEFRAQIDLIFSFYYFDESKN